jgi:uncharacterized membrane protein HdeD (DUF308 family)
MADSSLDGRLWGGLALRGVVAILFGILAFSRPGTTAMAIVYLFGVYAFVDGIFALVAATRVARVDGRWMPMMLVGLVGLVIGILAFARPAATAAGLVYYVSVWAILTGVLEVFGAFRLRRAMPGEWLLAVAGLLSIAFGIMIAARPSAGLVGLIWMIGAYAIIFGGLELSLAFRLRRGQQPLVTA